MEWLEKIAHRDFYLILALIIFFTSIYFLIKKIVIRSRMSNDSKRRAHSNLRMATAVIIILTAILIWSQELYSAALSIAAFAAALSIALKEVLMCFWGSFYRTFSHPFTVGDRIEIDGLRGDVIDIGLMATRILEVGPKNRTHQYTGRMVSIPNSKFISESIYNETRSSGETDDYALHSFIVPVHNDEKWKKKKDILKSVALETCEKYIEKANEYFTKLARTQQVDVPWIEPRINIQMVDPEKLNLIVRVSVPARSKGVVEQEIIHQYLKRVHE